MDPSGGNTSWWTIDPPRYLDINHQPLLYSSQSSQCGERVVQQHQQMVQQLDYNAYPMPCNQQVLEVPFQMQQGAQQNPPSISSLSNREFNIDLNTPGRPADPPIYHNLQESHSWQPSQRVEGNVQHHQQMVQHPGYSSCPMPIDFNYIAQLDNEVFADTEAGNWSFPPTNGNNPDKIPSPDRGYSSESRCHATYQEPPQPFPVRYENIESSPETNVFEYDKLGMDQENSGVYRSDQFLVVYPQPIDTNGGQILENNKSYLHETIPLKQLDTNELPQIIDLPNPQNSQVQVQTQYKISNKTPEGQTSDHRGVSSYTVRRRALRSRAVKSSAFKCAKCELFFNAPNSLIQHQRWLHTDRNFQCKRCSKKYPSQKDLDKHIAMHDMPHKPFKCSVCPKEFCHKSDLRRHMLRHSDSTPYKCDICSKRFLRNSQLLEHQLTKVHKRRAEELLETFKKPIT